MQTKMNLMATETGDYRGLSTNFSGPGFSNMNFIVRASTQQDFDQWVNSTQKSNEVLTDAAYTKLALPSENNIVESFTLPNSNLYANILMKYMMPMGSNTKGMDMAFASN
jgi:cytochrome o ubiquinol oxidase subunit II